ncbi:hypothetical protein TNCV_1380671 [Trichonephila clavipes]|nr:hypothetical protein TNCV_1380671 [Trichonephila clavipes]
MSQTLEHLEDNFRRVIADIRPQMLEKVIENWTSRLNYIRASRGSPMPEIIFKIATDVFATNSAMKEGFGRQNGMKLSLLHWSCTGYYAMGRYWISLLQSSRTHCRYFKQPALHLRGLELVVLPYFQGLATAIFQQDNA